MNNNILVTGAHRSGTTWTGDIIAKAPKVRYVHEPFNMDNPGIGSPFTYWYEYLNETPIQYQHEVKKYLNTFSYPILHNHTITRLLNIRSLREAYNFLVDLKGRINSNRTVYKDPIALMSAEWIYENYNWNVVILIRHPAAFVASCKMKGWGFEFSNFLNQEKLMKKHFMGYSEILEDYSKNNKDFIDQNILVWNILHEVIAYYKEKYGEDWVFVKHETISMDPISEFRKIFSKLNLKFNKYVKNHIVKSTTSNKKSRLKRNSVDNIKTWKNRLTPEEIQRIKLGTKKVWTKFYTEEDW